MNSLELFVFLQKNMTSMKKVELKSVILECQMEELSAEDRQLIEQAIEATSRSYAPYSHFHVGAAVRLENGKTVIGCNQENAAYPSGLCAERTALFAAGAQYPDTAVEVLAIAARGTDGELTEEPTGHHRIRDTRQAPHPHPDLRTSVCLHHRWNQVFDASYLR